MLKNVRAFCQSKGWEQVQVNVLGDRGVPEVGADYSLPQLYA